MSDSVRAAIRDCKLKDTRMKAQLLRRVPVVHTDSQMPSGIFVLKVACYSKELAPGKQIPFVGMKHSLHACLWRAPGRRDRGVGSGWEGGEEGCKEGLTRTQKKQQTSKEAVALTHTPPPPSCPGLTPLNCVNMCPDVRLSCGTAPNFFGRRPSFLCVVSRKGI